MAISNFMQWGGAPGSAQDVGKTGWLNIEPFQLSASNRASFAVGSGGGNDGADLHDMHIVAVLDKAMPVIFNKMATGDVTSEVKLAACKMVGKQQVDYQVVTLKNVFVRWPANGDILIHLRRVQGRVSVGG
jgi:type VI protein secretion system component Hcp